MPRWGARGLLDILEGRISDKAVRGFTWIVALLAAAVGIVWIVW